MPRVQCSNLVLDGPLPDGVDEAARAPTTRVVAAIAAVTIPVRVRSQARRACDREYGDRDEGHAEVPLVDASGA